MNSGLIPAPPRNQMRSKPYGRRAWEVPSSQPVGGDPHRGGDRPVPLPAVVIAGSPAQARSAVLGELLRVGEPILAVPADSYLVLRYGPRRAATAYLPGYRNPQFYPASAGVESDDRAAPADRGAREGQPAELLPRPPRRVELTLPTFPLANFTMVDTPAAGAFGTAYTRIVLDTAERAGALLVTMDARVLPSQAELDFLTLAAQRAVVPFFAAWAGGCDDGSDQAASDAPVGTGDPAQVVATYRDVVATRVPRFADAPWFLVLPDSGAADLGQALIDWARSLDQRPAAGTLPAAPAVSGVAPVPVGGTLPAAGPVADDGLVPGAGRRAVPTAVDGRESGWEDLLDRVARAAQHSVRQRLTIELANIHLRCVQDIVFGAGCPGLPAALDREMHALSLTGADEVHAAITEMTRQVLAHVLAEAPYDEVLHRVAEALRQRVEEDGPNLDRNLLITSTNGGVAAVSGSEATAGMAAYHPGPYSELPRAGAMAGGARVPFVLPPLGIGLSASCYQKWREAKADPTAARGWLQEAVRGTELELQRVLAERFEAVHQVLGALVAEAVDHGLLLV